MKPSYVIILMLIGFGCSRSPDKKAFNVQKANQEIIRTVGIDLLNYKNKVDQLFPEDSFYIDLSYSIMNSNVSPIYEELGSIVKYDNGKPINSNEADSLVYKIAQALAHSVYIEECNNKSIDSAQCQFNQVWKTKLLIINTMPTLTPTNTTNWTLNEYRKGHLTYEEFAYMCIIDHFLVSVCYMDK